MKIEVSIGEVVDKITIFVSKLSKKFFKVLGESQIMKKIKLA